MAALGMASSVYDLSHLFIELGCAIVGLAVLARLANRFGFSAIPLYLLAGLAFGNGGLAPLNLSKDFIHIGAEIGVLLLLFMLGLEYTGHELKENLRSGLPAGITDLALNFPPGLIAGLLMGWSPMVAVLLGGVTYISSSGVIAKVLAELRRLENPETPSILSVLVLEDLAMAIYLPLVGVLLVGGGPATIAFSVAIAVAAVVVVLFVAVRYGEAISHFAAHESDEIILLSTFGTVLLVAGLAQRFQVSAAVVLGLVTALTKIATGYWAVRRAGGAHRARLSGGMALVARGEFSIVIAGLGYAVEPRLGPLSAAYVLFLAILGPLLARAIK